MAVEIRAATYAALRTALAAGTYQAGQMVFVEGRAAAGDGGQGTFQVQAIGSLSDDGGVTLTGGSLAAVRAFEGAANVRWFGAAGDGVTDETAEIQAALDYAYAKGGGVVLIPEGHYITSDNLRIKDNVYLLGEGYGSHILNSATTGFEKSVLVTGNMGDPINANSMFEETAYDIGAVAAGDFEVTLVTAGDATNFAVGDIVGIASYETWSNPVGTHEKILNQNEVVAIDSGTITLRWALPRALSDSSGNPTIRTLSGGINGYDGDPLWMSKNCGASNLRLTQSTGNTSGWYAIFSCGVNQQFENIWMDDCSTLIGSNNLSYSTFRNIKGRFEAGFLDFAEWQNDNLIENVIGTRFAANANLNRIGLSHNNGADCIFRNVVGFLGGYGRFALTKVYGSVFDRCTVIAAGEAEAMLLGYGDGCEATNCLIVDPFQNGIVLVGENHRVSECRVPTVGASGYSVYATSGIDVLYVHDNEFGTEGAITASDRFFQQTAQSVNAHVYNNTGYVEHEAKKGKINTAEYAQTNSTSYATLRTASVKGTTGVSRGYRVFASGARSGTAGTKSVRLKLGANPIGTVTYSAPDTATWDIEAVINVNAADSVRASYKAYLGTTLQQNAIGILAGALSSDTTITVEALVANAADSIGVYQFIVEPIE